MKKFYKLIYQSSLCIVSIFVLIGIFCGLASGVTTRTFYPFPFAFYNFASSLNAIQAPFMVDRDDSNYRLDPCSVNDSDRSIFNILEVWGNISAVRVEHPTDSNYYADLNGHCEINTDIVVDGEIQMLGAAPAVGGKQVWDIAEGIKGVDCKASDVVVIHPDIDEAVMVSSKAYDSAVAGIISTDPGVYIYPVEDGAPLAVTGKVPCKVTGENGPIKIGDLLVTSSTAGHAMKADIDKVKPGMVIGKAMGNFDGTKSEDTGKIIVLINAR